jgi:hypothetical protein
VKELDQQSKYRSPERQTIADGCSSARRKVMGWGGGQLGLTCAHCLQINRSNFPEKRPERNIRVLVSPPPPRNLPELSVSCNEARAWGQSTSLRGRLKLRVRGVRRMEEGLMVPRSNEAEQTKYCVTHYLISDSCKCMAYVCLAP